MFVSAMAACRRPSDDLGGEGSFDHGILGPNLLRPNTQAKFPLNGGLGREKSLLFQGNLGW